MPYSEKQLVKAPMKPSPSLIYNNLANCSGSLVYAHIRQACTLAPSGLVDSVPVAVRKLDSQHSDVIHSVTACYHGAVCFLVLATDAGVQVWDRTATHLLHASALPASEASATPPRHASFARCTTMAMAGDGTPYIAYGSASGGVYCLALGDEDGRFRAAVALPRHHASPITALGSAYQARQGKWTEDLGCNLVSCDEDGGIAVWEAAGVGAVKLLHAIPPTGVPVVSVAVRRDLIVAARLDGAVQLYGMRDGKLRADLGAASRLLTAMSVHPTKDVIAVAAEDATLSVWALPIGGAKAECLLSSVWLHALPTGVAFCGPTHDDVAVVAYDTDEVRLYKCTA